MTIRVHNYRLRQFHRTSNGQNPSSGCRDMCSASLATTRTLTTMPLLPSPKGWEVKTDNAPNTPFEYNPNSDRVCTLPCWYSPHSFNCQFTLFWMYQSCSKAIFSYSNGNELRFLKSDLYDQICLFRKMTKRSLWHRFNHYIYDINNERKPVVV